MSTRLVYVGRLGNLAPNIFDPARQCRFCGTFAGDHRDHKGRRACPPTTCPVCGSTSCHEMASGDGLCPVCHIGYFGNWYHHERTCQRAGCGKPAVGIYRRRAVCKDHLPPITPDLSAFVPSDEETARLLWPDSRSVR